MHKYKAVGQELEMKSELVSELNKEKKEASSLGSGIRKLLLLMLNVLESVLTFIMK